MIYLDKENISETYISMNSNNSLVFEKTVIFFPLLLL